MLRPGVRVAGTFARAALLTGLMGLGSALACSLIVGEFPTTVFCTPDAGPAVCGPDQVCAPLPTGTQYSCVKNCLKNPCRTGETCNQQAGWCEPATVGDAGVETGDAQPSDASTPEAPVDVVVANDVDAGGNDAQPQCAGFGCACNANAVCQSPYACVDSQAVTRDIWTGWQAQGGRSDGGFCAKPCCTSDDCDMGDGGSASVCFATGAGGNYCVPAMLLGDRNSIGVLGGGANCGAGPGPACRSGLCLDAGAGMTCADTCCSTRMAGNNAQCAGQSVCLFRQFPGAGFDTHESATCGLPGGFYTSGNPCMMNSDCLSNLCVDAGGTFNVPGSCQDPCRSANDCVPTGFRLPPTCEYLQPDPTIGAPDIVAACYPGRLGSDAGVAVCFYDSTGVQGDCQTGERCRPQLLTVEGMSYSVLGCGN